ncbi:MAG: hypothetical protein II863_01805 [Kiritimatiellae bacterium]|nr:hypothetical protein [Kiritimatiellia bacterium]
MAIEAVTIATNRYAPAGSEAISLYSTDTASGLTLGQLVIAVCMRAAMSYEAQSVNKMNTITKSAQLLEKSTEWVNKILDGTVSWSRAKSYLINTLGLSEEELPDDLRTYDNRLKAASAATSKLNSLMQVQQQDMVAMQSYVSRRDVSYSSSSNIVRALGRSMSNMASKI